MDSFFARNRLSAYLDHTLPRSEAEAVAEAVARDISLSADLRAMKRALTLLSESGQAPAPTGFHARTMASVAQRPVPGSQVAWLQRRLARVPTELIAVVGAAIIIMVALNSKDSTDDGLEVQDAPAAAVQPIKNSAAAPGSKTASPESVPALKSTAPPASNEPKSRPAAKPRGADSAPIAYDAANPLAYRILHGGDQVLYDIATLADETGGRLVDVHGKLVSPHSLSEARSFSQLYLITHSDRAANAHQRLMARCGMDPYPLDGPKPPLDAGEVVFLIEAQL